MFLDRFYPPEDPDPRFMRAMERLDDVKWDLRKLERECEECEDEDERIFLESRWEYLRETMRDIETEMERFADDGCF